MGITAAAPLVEAAPETSEAEVAEVAALSAPGGSAGHLLGLSPGARGEKVVELQERLSALGVWVPGGADGQFGAGTETALKNFQRWNSIGVTGTVTQATVNLFQRYRTPIASSSNAGSTSATPTSTAKTTKTTNATTATAISSGGGTAGYVGLERGSRGARVKELQQALMRSGVTVRGGADGVFGPLTEQALMSFQRSRQLAATGRVTAREADLLGLTSSGGNNTPTPPPTTSPKPSNPANPYVGLKLGSRGNLVKDLQSKLIAAGVTVRGGADGIFGPVTTAALRSYQQAVGINTTGTVNQATVDKLKLGTNQGPVPFANGGNNTPTPPPSPKPSNPANPYVGLQIGARGALVKELQQALLRTGISVRGGADGVFGPATQSALKAFQSVNGIPQSGRLTEKGAGILGLGSDGPGSGYGSGSGTAAAGYPVFGERGERVKALQQALLRAGISFAGGADGNFGGATTGAIVTFQRREGLRATGVVDAATAGELGLSPMQPPAPPSTAGVVLRRFPIEGPCWFGDTWHAPRGGGRLHVGVDIIAAEGKKLYAVVDGTISKMYYDAPGARAGNGLRVAQDDGTYFTYLHLSAFAEGIEVGTKVKAGDVIGYNGNTGNSATAHLHFEIHPKGGAAINPYPFVKAIDAC